MVSTVRGSVCPPLQVWDVNCVSVRAQLSSQGSHSQSLSLSPMVRCLNHRDWRTLTLLRTGLVIRLYQIMGCLSPLSSPCSIKLSRLKVDHRRWLLFVAKYKVSFLSRLICWWAEILLRYQNWFIFVYWCCRNSKLARMRLQHWFIW